MNLNDLLFENLVDIRQAKPNDSRTLAKCDGSVIGWVTFPWAVALVQWPASAHPRTTWLTLHLLHLD